MREDVHGRDNGHPETDPSLPIFNELLHTEAAYVKDLQRLCDELLEPVRRSGSITKEQECAIFANCNVIRRVNEELLKELSSNRTQHNMAMSCAAAFCALAPYLRAYSDYCSNFVLAQSCLAKERAQNASFEAILGQAESNIGQPALSMLIKPVQRLCKYPLLLAEFAKQLPPGEKRQALQKALHTVQAITEQVNERVRQAEGRAQMVQLAEQLAKPELVTPQRTLMLQLDVEAQKLPSTEHDSLGARHENRIWLCSDVVLLGKPARSSSSAAYELVQQGPLARAELEQVALSSSGPSALRLCTSQPRCVTMLWVREPDAANLLRSFRDASDVDRRARERREQASQDRAKITLASIEERRAGVTQKRREAVRRRRTNDDSEDVGSAAAVSASVAEESSSTSLSRDAEVEGSATPRRRHRCDSGSEARSSLSSSLSWARSLSWTSRLLASRNRTPSDAQGSAASLEASGDHGLGGIAAGPSLAKPRKISCGAADSSGSSAVVPGDDTPAASLAPPPDPTSPQSPPPPPIPPVNKRIGDEPQPRFPSAPSSDAASMPVLKRLPEAWTNVPGTPEAAVLSPRYSPRSSTSEPFDTTAVDMRIDSIKRRLVVAGLQL